MSKGKNTLSAITGQIIFQLYNNGNINRGALATLRRTTSITDKGAEKVWPIIFSNMVVNNKDKAPIFLSKNGKPTKQEIAIYTALHCYAMFQQGNDQTCAYAQINTKKDSQGKSSPEDGVTLFSALREIRNDNSQITEALDRRVSALLATTNINNAVNSIIHLVNILKGKKITTKIDFGQLASDLDVFQSSLKQAREVALKWGQDYYWNTYQLEKKDK